jgi:2-polyprenyl-3-methyl-5-hydroxy-6-metoxy-1,4-benzoquinol methylase
MAESIHESSDLTLNYYNSNAQRFTGDTLEVEFSNIQDSFLALLPPGSLILDFGCGSGRDSRYFLQKGYQVEACDGSEEMVKAASQNVGISVKKMLFSELDETDRYDGIFACASILHVPSKELPDIITRMKKAVKTGGILYISFKYGTFEGIRNGRYFTDLTEESLQTILDEVGGLEIIRTGITGDARPGRGDEKWLNVLLRANN